MNCDLWISLYDSLAMNPGVGQSGAAERTRIELGNSSITLPDETAHKLLAALLDRFNGDIRLESLPADRAMKVLDGLFTACRMYDNELRGITQDAEEAAMFEAGADAFAERPTP